MISASSQFLRLFLGYNEFPLEDHFNYTQDAVNNGLMTDDKARYTSNSNSDRER